MANSPFTFLPLGALIQSFKIGDLDIVLGFPLQDDYEKHNTFHFGVTVGRVANRIENATLNDIDGKTWTLDANLDSHCLHGGSVGWGKRLWSGPISTAKTCIPGMDGLRVGESLTFRLVSQHGDQGFPGTVETSVTYTTGTQAATDNGSGDVTVLGVDMEARLVDDAAETVVNMTNHSYFNLSGAATVDGTVITLPTRNHLPVVHASSIPTGQPPEPYAALDTTQPFTMTAHGPNVDSCFTLAADPAAVPLDTRSLPLALNLAAHHPGSGIHLEVLSTEPAFQFYTGHFNNVPAVNGAPPRGPRSGFCCEPGRFVNACNVPDWKNMTLLKKGDVYGARIVYRAWKD
ncbi:hypothetical protein CDD81_6598 [Ophiocordyceps australis]|uniref:Aldose 1-epimerase n=1 Tax=Ophiocordyceps australis TaxID=1399860 RepID=A0A2C5Y627_9HYPO|nr:hypothetical protein CDD81_6598 [Ophiocordyceps australis]